MGLEVAEEFNSSTGIQVLGIYFFQMALKSTKLDPNGVEMAI